MIRVRWELEEAVALMDLYFRCGATLSVPNDELLKLSQIYRDRANILGLNVDDKFRNLSGMKMQLGCIHYVVTDGTAHKSRTVPPQFVLNFSLRQNKSGGRFFALRSVDGFNLLGFGGDVGIEKT